MNDIKVNDTVQRRVKLSEVIKFLEKLDEPGMDVDFCITFANFDKLCEITLIVV